MEGEEGGGHVADTLSREMSDLQLTHLHWGTAWHLHTQHTIHNTHRHTHNTHTINSLGEKSRKISFVITKYASQCVLMCSPGSIPKLMLKTDCMHVQINVHSPERQNITTRGLTP